MTIEGFQGKKEGLKAKVRRPMANLEIKVAIKVVICQLDNFD
jgi:hypothetical protein